MLERFFEKSSSIKFHEKPSSEKRIFPCERTDMKKLVVAFRNVANTPKNLVSNSNVEYNFSGSVNCSIHFAASSISPSPLSFPEVFFFLSSVRQYSLLYTAIF